MSLGLNRFGLGLRNRNFGSSFFDQFGTPAQAWALWDVDGGGGNYVEVQRTSDDTTQNFTMAEIEAEADVSWVNEDVSKSYEFSAGSDGLLSVGGTLDAPESIAGVSDALRFTVSSGSGTHFPYEFNVFGSGGNCQISFDYYIPSSNTDINGIQASDGSTDIGAAGTVLDDWTSHSVSGVLTNSSIYLFTLKGGLKSFTGNGTDVVYIKNLVLTQTSATGLVKSWYNPASGLTATQSNAADMPVVVDNGVAVSDNGKRAIQSDGTQFLQFATATLTGGFCIMAVHNGAGFLAGQSTGGNDYIRLTGYQRLEINGVSYQNNDNRDNLQTISTFNRTTGNNLSIYYNEIEGVNSPFAGASGNWGTNSLLSYNGGTIVFTGKIQAFIMYDEDKSADLAAMQETIVNEFSIP